MGAVNSFRGGYLISKCGFRYRVNYPFFQKTVRKIAVERAPLLGGNVVLFNRIGARAIIGFIAPRPQMVDHIQQHQPAHPEDGR